MTVVLNLPDELEQQLQTKATELGLAIPEYILSLLQQQTQPTNIQTGAQLVDYWEQQGLIGTRTDLSNVTEYADELRARSQNRN
jgi:hypothetical protein